MELVRTVKSMTAAINLCMNVSGLDDKEICITLDIDPGHFSNIRSGKGHFPLNKLNDLMDLCGNQVPLIWLAHSRGYGLVVLRTEAERRADELQSQLVAEREKNRLLIDVLQGRAA